MTSEPLENVTPPKGLTSTRLPARLNLRKKVERNFFLSIHLFQAAPVLFQGPRWGREYRTEKGALQGREKMDARGNVGQGDEEASDLPRGYGHA